MNLNVGVPSRHEILYNRKTETPKTDPIGKLTNCCFQFHIWYWDWDFIDIDLPVSLTRAYIIYFWKCWMKLHNGIQICRNKGRCYWSAQNLNPLIFLFYFQSDLKQICAGALPDDFAKSKVSKVSCYIFWRLALSWVWYNYAKNSGLCLGPTVFMHLFYVSVIFNLFYSNTIISLDQCIPLTLHCFWTY